VIDRFCRSHKTVAVTSQSHRGQIGGIPPDLRSGTSCLRSTTSNNRSCTSQLRSSTFVAVIHHSAHFILEYFSLCLTFCKKCSSGSFCHLHLSMLGVDRCCKRQILFKCHKSQTECLECSKTHLGNTTSALGTSGSSFGPSILAPVGIQHLLLSNLTTAVTSQLHHRHSCEQHLTLSRSC